MRDQESVEMSRLRSPGANPGARAGTIQVDRAARAGLVPSAVGREMLLVRAPPEFGGLGAFADEALHQPRIDEILRHLRPTRYLSCAFGAVDDPGAAGLGTPGP